LQHPLLWQNAADLQEMLVFIFLCRVFGHYYCFIYLYTVDCRLISIQRSSYLAYRLFGSICKAHFDQSARLAKRDASLTKRAAHLANCESLTLTLT